MYRKKTDVTTVTDAELFIKYCVWVAHKSVGTQFK